MIYEQIKLETVDTFIRIITINRPEVSNAMGTQGARELVHVLSSLREDPNCRCIVLTGAGEKAFCAGGDLKERNNMSDAQWQAQHVIIENLTFSFTDLPIPIIAMVNGAAYGGGCEMALSCDFIYASSNARFALTETRLGIMPGAGGTQNLARAVGTRRAMELILTAQPFSAEQAYNWGMVNYVVTPEDLLSETLNAASSIAKNGPLAITQAKKSISKGIDMDIRSALQFEIEAYSCLVGSEDRLEGVRAFNEKRPPSFTGK